MRVAGRDTPDNGEQKLLMEFTASEIGFLGLGIGYSRYGHARSSDEEIVKKFSALFANQSNAHSIAVSQFYPATILKDVLNRLDVWFDQAAMVTEDKTEPDRVANS